MAAQGHRQVYVGVVDQPLSSIGWRICRKVSRHNSPPGSPSRHIETPPAALTLARPADVRSPVQASPECRVVAGFCERRTVCACRTRVRSCDLFEAAR